MGKYSSDSENEKRGSKNRGRRRSSSTDSSDSRNRKRRDKKSSRRSRSRSRSKYSRRSRSRSSSSVYRSLKSRSYRSKSRDRHKDRRRRSRSHSRDSRYKPRRSRSRSKSYIREFVSKPKRRSSSSSSSSSDDKRRSAKPKSAAISNKANEVNKDNIELSDCVVIDSKVLDEIDEDKFSQKEFSSSKSKKVPDNIVIDLTKNTIKVPEVEPSEPDTIFHHSLFLSEEARMEKWVKELYSFRQKHYNRDQLKVTANTMKQLLYILIIPISLSIIIFISLRTLKLSVQELCDRDSCPRCFGEDMCEFIESGYISLQFNRISDICFNLISVKNVFFGRYHDKRVVLKKQLETNSNYYFIKNDLIEYLSADNNVLNNFKICNRVTAQTLFDQFKSVNPVNFEFALRFSVEPILLELFPSHSFPVPYLYGVCGRLMVVEYAGDTPLVNTVNYPWPARAYVAFQLLKAATAFTEAHNLFRLYLTDVSPDNIVVDEQFHIRFIDLDNAILSQKGLVRKENLHYSEHFEEDVFIFSENKICEADRSDHNIYSVCRLLLSKSAPWPMMNGGLLHNPPEDIVLNYPKLFQHIQECVFSTRHKDRFILSEQILQDLESILDNKF